MPPNREPLIEIFRPGSLGDLLMMTALFTGFKRLGFRVRCICSSYYYSILQGHPDIDTLIVLPREHNLYSSDAYQYATQQTGEKADYSHTIRYADWWDYPGLPTQILHEHILANFCSQVGLPYTEELSVHLTDEMLSWGQQFSDCVLIQTKTAWSPYKNWSMSHWQGLSHLIQSDIGYKVMQLGHPDDPELQNVEKINSPTILHAIAALKFCKLFIGLDSVFNHASKAVGKQSIILWGSTNPAAFAYRHNINLVNGVVWTHELGNGAPLLKCQPCYREYKHIEADTRLACPHTVYHPEHSLPVRAHPEPALHACMAANTLFSVYYHTQDILGRLKQA